MTSVLLIVHLFVTLALIGLVLIQRSEGGGLGIGSSQGMGAFMGGRGTANLLTRTTAILGALFFALSLVLALLNRGTNGPGRSLLDTPPPLSAPAVPPTAIPGSGSRTPPALVPSTAVPPVVLPTVAVPSVAPVPPVAPVAPPAAALPSATPAPTTPPQN